MVSILDAVIRTIRNSKDKKDAKENIMINYSFTEIQAEAIVMLQLYRLTNTDIVALQNEAQELTKKISELHELLTNESVLLKVIKTELLRAKESIHQERRTKIEDLIEEIKIEQKELISKEEVVLIITHHGYLKRMSKKAFSATSEPTHLKDGDVINSIFEVTTTDTLLQFTNLGNYVYLPIHKIPDVKHRDLGYHVSTLIGMEADERLLFSTVVSNFNEDKYVLIATKKGLIKRILLTKLDVSRYSRVLKATKLRKGDVVVSADISTGLKGEVVVATKDGYMNRYDAEEISVLEPASYGVKAIELKGRADDYLVSAKYVQEKDIIILLTNRGNIKRMRPDEINRGKKNHVGRMYLKIVRSNMHEAIAMDVIHHKNANSDLESFIYCEKGYFPIDYTILRIAIAENGRKMVPADQGKPKEIVIQRNNFDLDL